MEHALKLKPLIANAVYVCARLHIYDMNTYAWEKERNNRAMTMGMYTKKQPNNNIKIKRKREIAASAVIAVKQTVLNSTRLNWIELN